MFTSKILWKVLAVAASASVSVAFGQTELKYGTIVTGQCTNSTAPGCVLPNLFGSQGVSLFNNQRFPHFAHFIGSSQTTLNQTLGTAIATQLTILPLISPASGFTYTYDSAAGAFVRNTSSFGPIYTERAETIGRGQFAFGASYQRFRFDSLDGINLKNIPAVFTHVPHTGMGGAAEPYEADVIDTTNSVSLNMDQTLLYGTVGVTNRIDLSVAVPIVSVRMNATSAARIVRVSGNSVTVNGVSFNPHEFDANGTLSKSYGDSASAAGIGDVTIRAKGSIFETETMRVALALDIRTPTGSARDLLGSGAVGIKPFLIVSGRQRFAPHLNTGFQWNGNSILAGNITGTIVSENSAGKVQIQNGPATKGKLPNEAIYSVGFDYGATRKLTIAADYLGQLVINAPRVFRSTFVTQNIAGGTGAIPLPDVSGGKDTIGLNSGAVGMKYNLFGKFLLTADILFRLDNRGLRQDVTPLVALSYALGK